MTTETKELRGLGAAIVTGGGTGIGAAICLALAALGHPVLVGWSRSKDGALNTVSSLLAAGGEGSEQCVDIVEEAQVEQLFQVCLARYGRPAAVINNAGIGHMANVADTSTADYERIFSVNARGTFFMCRQAAKQLADGGALINISSGITVASAAGMSLYTASKMAMEGFSKALAHELGSRGVRVNCVSPGMTDTPMLEQGDAQALREYGRRIAVMARLGEPEDIADAVAALVSPAGRWITGQNIHVDGGALIR